MLRIVSCCMREIILYRRNAQPLFSMVDDEMYRLCRNYRWYIVPIKNNKYAAIKDPKTVYMHRFIMEHHLGRKLDSKEEIDHIDGNGLNNQLSNLRIVNRSQNMSNQRLHRDSKSDYIGVHYNPRYKNPYRVKLMINYKNKYVNKGFDTPEEAAEQRDLLAVKYFGNNTKLNFEEKRQEYIKKIEDGYNPDVNDRKFSSKIPGISYQSDIKKWKCNVYKDKQQIYVGIFDTEEEANQARLKKCKELGIDPNKSRLKK
jgi:hypothetical protein